MIGTSADCKSVAYVCRRQYGVRSSATTDVSGSIGAAGHLCAHIEIKRLLERAPHLLHGRFGVRSVGSRLRKKIATTLFLDLVPEIARGLYPDGVPLAIIAKRFAETSL